MAGTSIGYITELEQINAATKAVTEKMQEKLELFSRDNQQPFKLVNFRGVPIIWQGEIKPPTQKQVAKAGHPDVMKRNIADDSFLNTELSSMSTERADGRAGAFVPISFGYYPNKSAWVRIAVIMSPRGTHSFDDTWPDEVQQSGPTHEVKLSVLNEVLSDSNEFRAYMANLFGVDDLKKVMKNQRKFLHNMGASLIRREKMILAEQFPHIGVF